LLSRLAILIGGVVACWLLAAVPARYFGGDWAVAYSATAMLLCLIPAIATLIWGGWALARSPEQQLVMVLGGSGVRMFVALCGALALHRLIPYFQEHEGFLFWVLGFYLVTLGLEMALLLNGSGNRRSDSAEA
jgi:hypothetical protein